MNAEAPGDIAIRLADEGVPLGAIARSVRIPSEDLREHLAAARDDGRLLKLPRADWPPGYPRDRRAVELSRLMTCDRVELVAAAKQLFDLTAGEAELLLTLMQSPVLRREAATSNLTCVHIHRIRKRLAAFRIEIMTLWGVGYRLPDAGRRRAMDLLLART